MKTTLISLLCLLFSLNIFGQVKKTKYDSTILGETRQFQFYIPEDYDPEKKYPLFIVLDGDYLFDLVVASVKFNSYNDLMPKSIVVGINQGYNNLRFSDCDFSDEDGLPKEKGKLFFDFIEREVVPLIQQNYNLAEFKAVAGHGITANFINYYLFKDNPLFDAYISLSPTFAPQMTERIADRLSQFEDRKFYYLANSERNLDKEDKERISALNGMLKTIDNPKFYYFYDNFENATPFTAASYGIPKAIDLMFDLYEPISKEEYDKNVITHEAPVINYLIKKQETIKELFGFEKPIPLNDIMAIYSVIKTKKYDDLESLERLSDISKKEFPDTMLGFFFLAEYYEQMGEPKKALKTYENAFTMSEIDFLTKDLMLDRITSIKEDFGY
ncbi:alpha/beta hydrolase [Abyssalbus ytuae]|uniref:Alpha/beta hydrolase-fold protein n=1 Tax=Abyssalbus ytuae TaxID=2926907 RepID=A0A9E6ZIK8_9FLAO|nr:alpha/beta hydrolase-fold protein [Abyssalbus ytuae]UOB16202.1 alpha/beta hydrolase-fold protein [Abyssalbus ytuae]